MRAIREVLSGGFGNPDFARYKGAFMSKLIINVGINALTAITRLNNGRLVEFVGTRKILREAVTEATRIAKRKRIKLIYDDPLAKVEAVAEATLPIFLQCCRIFKKETDRDRFYQRSDRALWPGIEYSCAVNALLVDLVKTIEASYNLAIER